MWCYCGLLSPGKSRGGDGIADSGLVLWMAGGGWGGVQEYDPCASRPALRLALLGLSSAVSDGPL